MSDPDFRGDETPPLQPPRPAPPRNQVEADAIYARQLADHYQSGFTQPGARGRQQEPRLPQRRQETGLKPNELYDREHSFFDGTYTFHIYSFYMGPNTF